MNPLFVVLDIALAVLAVRSVLVLRSRAPWTRGAWAATVLYCCAAIVEFSNQSANAQRPAAVLAYLFLLLLAVGFVVAGVRDEPQAEPWYWPQRAGKTRAERRS